MKELLTSLDTCKTVTVRQTWYSFEHHMPIDGKDLLVCHPRQEGPAMPWDNWSPWDYDLIKSLSYTHWAYLDQHPFQLPLQPKQAA